MLAVGWVLAGRIPSEFYLGAMLLKCGTNSLNIFSAMLTPNEMEPRLAASAAVVALSGYQVLEMNAAP